VGFALLWPNLNRRVERLMLSDAYDTEETVLHLNAELARTVPQESSQVAVTHARSVMDVTFSLLLTSDGEWWSVHPQSYMHDTLQIDVVRHARDLLNVPSQAVAASQGSVSVRLLHEQTILFLPVRVKHENLAVLCMGPKRSEDLYTDQDRSLLGTLCYQLAVKLQEQHLHTRMVEQDAKLRALGGSEALTAREIEVLSYAAQGLVNKEIARKLVLHTRTVEKRFTNIFRKWGVRNRQEAVYVAQQKGLISLASPEAGDGESGS
jgi:DNA-binding CsgD family transcriptional regulator